jgi:hypothetical protein
LSFPSFSGVAKDLKPSLFNSCYDVLAKKITEETPINPTLPPEYQLSVRQQLIGSAMADLSLWQGYALDGDVTTIPGDGPWKILMDNGNKLYHDAYIKWEVAAGELEDVWSGPGHTSAKEYLDNTTKLLEGYCPSTDSKSGFIPQVATALLDAYATAAAFKQDLYNLAKKASDKLDAIENAKSSEDEGVGLIIAGIALEGLGGAAGASDSVFVQGAGGVLTFLGGLVFDAGKKKYEESIGGRDPQEIMHSLAAATRKAADYYSTAAENVGRNLSSVWVDIDGKKRKSITRPVATPSPNVSIEPSIQISKLFPAE